MRYYIITGEHSGDMHGADLITAIRKIDPHADFWSCGGAAMQKAMGQSCRIDCSKMAYMGIDFLKRFYSLWRLLIFCQKNLIAYHPDAVILIDYSGFNMRVAAFAKQNGFQVYYYIPPKIWAHGRQRIAKIKRDVDHVLSILPFEVTYYQDQGYSTIHYVGNPLVQKIAQHRINPFFIAENGLDQRPIMALLPGSRLDEIQRILPIMVTQVDHFKAYQLVVAGLTVIPSRWYQKLCPPTIKVVYDQTYDLLAMAKVGMIASGTASLEAALFNLLQVVVYKTNPLTYFIYKNIVTIQYISLVNLLVEQAAVPELIQGQLTSQKLHTTLTNLLQGNGSAQQKEAYQAIRRLLGKQNAAVEAAKTIVASTKQSVKQ